jgi:hypothetical protein
MILDASTIKDIGECLAAREDVKLNQVEFIFPRGRADADLLEKCRAISNIDDFSAAYAFSMLLCSGTELVINIKDGRSSVKELCRVMPADWPALRDVEMIARYPVLIVWLTDHIKTLLLQELGEALQEMIKTSDAPVSGGGEGSADSYEEAIIRKNFGDPLLFLCYEYMAKMHMRPGSFRELFESLGHTRVINVLKELALKRAGTGNG